jgi:hypothetical protein
MCTNDHIHLAAARSIRSWLPSVTSPLKPIAEVVRKFAHQVDDLRQQDDDQHDRSRYEEPAPSGIHALPLSNRIADNFARSLTAVDLPPRLGGGSRRSAGRRRLRLVQRQSAAILPERTSPKRLYNPQVNRWALAYGNALRQQHTPGIVRR